MKWVLYLLTAVVVEVRTREELGAGSRIEYKVRATEVHVVVNTPAVASFKDVSTPWQELAQWVVSIRVLLFFV